MECFADDTSRGYAFIQFQNEEDAQAAVSKTNGTEFGGKTMEVMLHVRRQDEQNTERKSATGNNVFVQGFAKGTTDKQVSAMFSQFGEIVSCLV